MGSGSYGIHMYSVHNQEVGYFGSFHVTDTGLGYSDSLRASDIGSDHLGSLNEIHVGFLLDSETSESSNTQHCVG